VDIIREGYDLAVRMGALQDTELISRKLADLRWILVASPAYIERILAAGTVEDLRSHACLRYMTSGRPWPFAFANGQSVVPDGPFDTDDSGAIRQAALGSAGIAIPTPDDGSGLFGSGAPVQGASPSRDADPSSLCIASFWSPIAHPRTVVHRFVVEKLSGLDL